MYAEWINQPEIQAKLKEDINKMKDIYLSSVAEEAANKITQKAKSEIERFYADRPLNRVYERTYNLKKNSYQKVINRIHDYYEAGVHISADLMNDYIQYKWQDHHIVKTPIPGAKEAVAHDAWMEGKHGPKWNVVQITQPSPWDSLYDYAHSNDLKSYLKRYGIQQVAKGKYNFNYSF